MTEGRWQTWRDVGGWLSATTDLDGGGLVNLSAPEQQTRTLMREIGAVLDRLEKMPQDGLETTEAIR